MNDQMKNLLNCIKEKKKYDWISECKGVNVYIFGAGSLATTVIDILINNRIMPSGIFVDHSYYKEGQNIKNIPIYDWECYKKETDIGIVMGMSDMRRGIELSKVSHVSKVIYPACLTFEENKLLTLDYFSNSINEFNWICDKMNDFKSIEVLKAWIEACITMYNPRIFECCEPKSGYFNNTLMDYSKIKNYVNFGAWMGDTIEEFCSVSQNYEKIWAIEGDSYLANILRTKYVQNNRIHIIEKIFWNKKEKIDFAHIEGVNSVGCTAKEINDDINNYGFWADTFDDFVKKEWKYNEEIDLISIAFRGEENTLVGARGVIQQMRPVIVAKVGFEKNCLYKVLKVIDGIRNDYDYYLRFKDNRVEELTLYAL